MFRPAMLLGLLAASTLAAAPAPAPAPTLAEIDASRFELHLGIRGGARMLGGTAFGGGAMLGLGVRLWQGLYLEATVGEGLFAQPRGAATTTDTTTADGFRHLGLHDEPSDAPSVPIADTTTAASADGPPPLLVGQILFGLRYEVRTPRTTHVRPSVFLGATHAHEATFADFLDTPGQALAGTGKFITHRTGVQVGVGLRVPFPSAWGPVAPRFSLRIDGDAAYYVDAHPGRLQAGLGLGLQAMF